MDALRKCFFLETISSYSKQRASACSTASPTRASRCFPRLDVNQKPNVSSTVARREQLAITAQFQRACRSPAKTILKIPASDIWNGAPTVDRSIKRDLLFPRRGPVESNRDRGELKMRSSYRQRPFYERPVRAALFLRGQTRN
jgi:hypothetical protein